MHRIVVAASRGPRSFRFPRLLAAFSLGLMLLSATLQPAPLRAEGPVTMQVRVGFDGRARAGFWTPVVVEVENAGPNLTAELVVATDQGTGFRGMSSAYSTEYAVEAALPQGSRKQFTIYAPLEGAGTGVTVRLVRGGATLAEAEGRYTTVADADALVGALAQNPNLAAALPAQGVLGQGRQWTLVPLNDQSLPALPQALRAFDFILLGDFVTHQLRPDQITALEDWVTQGGTLIVFGGAEARRSLGALPASLLPLAVEGSTTVSGAPALERWGRQPLPPGRPLTISTGSVTSGRTLLEQDGRPLAVLANRGEGRVLFLAFDPSLEPLAGWPGLAPLWREVLTRTAPALLLPAHSQPGMFGPMQGVSANYPNIISALTNMPALDLPSVKTLAGILAAYVLLVGPVNYLVLRRLRRRAWSWFTIPVLVALFSSGAFLLALRDKGSDVLTSTISILHLSPDGPRQRVESYVGVFAPSETSYRLTLPPGRLVSSLGNPEYYGIRRVMAGGQDRAPVGVRVRHDRSAVDLLGMSMWSMRSIATEYAATLPGGLEAELQLQGGKLRATLHNATGLHLEDGYLIAGINSVAVGELAPGERKTVVIDNLTAWDPRSGTPPPGLPMYSVSHSTSGPPTPEDRERMRKEQVLHAILSPKLSGMQTDDDQPVLFLGWTDDLPPDLAVNDQWVAGTALTAVLAPLSLKLTGAYELPAGLLRGYLVAVEGGSSFQGMAGGFQFAEGSVTLQFDAPFAAGDPVRTLKAAVPLNGNLLTSSAPFEAALYNWTRAAWDAATVTVDIGTPGTAFGKSLPPGYYPAPPPPVRGPMGVASSVMAFPAPGPGSSQQYLATPAGAAADYVAPDGTVRLKITKSNRDTLHFGTVTLSLEGGSNR